MYGFKSLFLKVNIKSREWFKKKKKKKKILSGYCLFVLFVSSIFVVVFCFVLKVNIKSRERFDIKYFIFKCLFFISSTSWIKLF